VKTVMAGGETVVEGGRHRSRSAIEARYKQVMAKMASSS
jgi:hypothetical protein